MLKNLEDFGLTESESKVYLALLRKGPSQAGVITKETGIHRRTIYDILYRLRSKGLISNIVINNNRFFEAVNPDRLLELLKEKEASLKEALPELKTIYKTTKEKKEVAFFRGKQALKTVFDDQIKEGKEILVMGKYIELDQVTKFYFRKFDKNRIDKKIHMKMIFESEARDIKNSKEIPLTNVKYINKLENSNMNSYIYGNNVVLVLWNEDPIAILIRQKEIADGFRSYFEIMWEIAKK